MDVPSGKWSTGALMRVIVPIALQLVLFQEVWGIVRFAPVTIALLTINLGLFFVLVHPRSWQTRILGLMLGGFAGFAVTLYYYAMSMQAGPPGMIGRMVAGRLAAWAGVLPGSGEGLAIVFQLLGRHPFAIEAILLDIVGIALIWAGGRLDHGLRGRAGRRAAEPAASAAGDEPLPAS